MLEIPVWVRAVAGSSRPTETRVVKRFWEEGLSVERQLKAAVVITASLSKILEEVKGVWYPTTSNGLLAWLLFVHYIQPNHMVDHHSESIILSLPSSGPRRVRRWGEI